MKGVIFDMDGTMVDNMMVHHRAWQKKLADLGIHMKIEEVQAEIHGINEEILDRLFGDRFDAAARKRISAEKEAAYREIFFEKLALVEGLPTLLDSLKSDDIPMAIGTAAPIENVDFVLDHLNLRPYFQAVLHAGSVDRGKPDPEIFIKAAAHFQVPPETCLIFEDSLPGAEAARRAGAKCIIVTTTHQADEFSHFNHILRFIEDFTDVTMEDLRSLQTQLN